VREGVRRDRAGQVEEGARVRPLFEARQLGREDRQAAEDLPAAEDVAEAIGITEGAHSLEVLRPLQERNHAAGAHHEDDEAGGGPVPDVLRFHAARLIQAPLPMSALSKLLLNAAASSRVPLSRRAGEADRQ